jgi:imidazolonepropionase
MFRHGTTTTKPKQAMGWIDQRAAPAASAVGTGCEGPLEIMPTFLGAHAIPPEYKDDPQPLHDPGCEDMLPRFSSGGRQMHPTALPFVDVFCETGAFTLEQSRQILTTAQAVGFSVENPCG